MVEPGYKNLISYQLARIAFDLGWDFVPQYYSKPEDGRQRDQIKQALRSLKQNIVEGSSERSLSSKLKLYDVARSSGAEAKEDFEDILRQQRLILWNKSDFRLKKISLFFEKSSNSSACLASESLAGRSYSSFPSVPSIIKISGGKGGIEGREGLEIVLNYLVDLLVRSCYLLDRQINALEEKHKREGGYNENLLRKRLEYRRNNYG